MKQLSTFNLRRLLLTAGIFLLSFTTAQAVCNANFSFTLGANGQVTFTNTSTGGIGPGYYWNFGDGNYAYTTNTSHTYTNNGMYFVCLTMYDSLSSCQDSYCDTVIISNISGPSCNANFTFTLGANGQVTFTNTSTGGIAPMYSWNFGDGGYAYTTNPSHTYASNGMYFVCLTMYDSLSSCQDTYCDTVIISNIGGPSCNANFTFILGANGQVTFTNTSTGGIAPMYSWNFGDGGYAYTTNPSHTYASNGMYFVCLTMYDSLSSCQDTYCDTVIISNITGPSCNANFTFTIGSNGQVNFTNTSTGAIAPSYVWSFGDGGYAYTTNATHQYSGSGLFVVCLTIYDSLSSCQDSYCDSIMVTGIRDYNSLTANLRAWPNPANAEVNLSFTMTHSGNAQVEIISLEGQRISTIDAGTLVAGDHQLHLSTADLAAGTYFIRLQTGDGFAVKRITIAR